MHICFTSEMNEMSIKDDTPSSETSHNSTQQEDTHSLVIYLSLFQQEKLICAFHAAECPCFRQTTSSELSQLS